jgi:hypothetical protein
MWLTFLFLPLIPLYGVYAVPAKNKGQLSFSSIHKKKLDWWSVLRTYLYGWILMPLLIFWPVPLVIHETQVALGLPAAFEIPLDFLAILWLVVAVWKLKNWDEERWFKP